MKLSNYLVLLVALVFLGGMTGCGKGNSAGGGEEVKKPTSSTPVTSGTTGYVNCQELSIDCIDQMISNTSAGKFPAAVNGKRYFYMAMNDEIGLQTSFQYYGTCYKVFKKWGWCDDDNYDYDIGSSFDFERKVVNSSTVERTTGDDTALSTNIGTLKSTLVSYLQKSRSLTLATGKNWTGTYNSYFYIKQTPTKFLIRVQAGPGRTTEFKDYIIDLQYPLAANPVYFYDGKTRTGYALAGESF